VSVEREILACILRDRNLVPVTDAGITPAHFIDGQNRVYYEYLLEHRQKHGEVPSLELFKRNYPIDLPEVKDATSYFLESLKTDYRRYLIERGIEETIAAYDADDLKGAEDAAKDMLYQVSSEIQQARITDITKTGQERMARYRSYRNKKRSLIGIPTGFGFLDRATQGWQPKQLITFAGPPKAGKSTMLELSMMAASRNYYRPLFIGFEMTNQEIEERWDSIRAKVSYKKLRDGTLTAEEYAALERATKRMSEMPPVLLAEDADSTMTVSGVASQIEKYDPEIVFVDGIYMMEDDRGEPKGSSFALTNITRDFKQLARNFNKPVVITTQVLLWKMDKKRGVTASSIGYSSSFAQDSDVLCSVEAIPGEPNMNMMKILLGRNTPYVEQPMRWDWETAEFEELAPVGGEYAEEFEEDEDPQY
jgi:replicative DNA helicase